MSSTEPELLLPKLVNRYKVKRIYPFIAILYIMAKFVEIDERIKFKDHSEEKIGGPVILINKFNVHPDKVIAVVVCLENIQSNVSQSKRRMGVISTNIFERQSVVDENNAHDERWLMIHHHSPPVSNYILILIFVLQGKYIELHYFQTRFNQP